MMNKVLMSVLVAVAALILLLLLAARSAKRAGEQALPSPAATVSVPTFSPEPTLEPAATPEVLTPEKEQLLDLEAAEGADLALEEDIDTDLRQLDSELRGI